MNGTEVRELWQLCGFKYQDYISSFGSIEEKKEGWFFPDNSFHACVNEVSSLPSLDDIEALGYLFKWVVPLLIKKHPNYSIHLERFAREDKFIARIGMDIVKADYDPAEALAQACLKALRKAK